MLLSCYICCCCFFKTKFSAVKCFTSHCHDTLSALLRFGSCIFIKSSVEGQPFPENSYLFPCKHPLDTRGMIFISSVLIVFICHFT
ncbi:hypothetical protein AALO_G00084140 [Alosa alosa]|uniref:Secreted protein n=1 Tax=Alosa alosa TaxID=278164 RepID=A0AAV6GY35_9TELE|nr:hypothetical protein AALO_G00084140 [Alosa alosa]